MPTSSHDQLVPDWLEGWNSRNIDLLMSHYADEAVRRVHARWDEKNFHHWCHTNSNAQIVAIGLLWGENEFGTSICRAVQPCFDCDCNGATVGSIYGMMHGARALPQTWTRPLNDQLQTVLTGYPLNQISNLAQQTCALIRTMPA